MGFIGESEFRVKTDLYTIIKRFLIPNSYGRPGENLKITACSFLSFHEWENKQVFPKRGREKLQKFHIKSQVLNFQNHVAYMH